MSEEKPEQPQNLQLAANIYKAITDNIIFSKKQQWAITNYTILIFGALFGISRTLTKLTSCEKALIVVTAAAVSVASILLLSKIQCDLGRFREQLISIHATWLSQREREVVKLKEYPSTPAMRGIEFVVALAIVVLVGCGAVIYSILRTA